MFSFPVRDIRSLGAGNMCSYLLLIALQLACCQGIAVDRTLRDLGEVKHIVPKQASPEANNSVVCVCGSVFRSETQKLKKTRIPKPSRISSPELQFPWSSKK